METSILTSTKKVLGLAADYGPFDLDVITHVNSAFSILTQLGVGPSEGFMIEDETAEWEDFTIPLQQMNLVKTYIYLKTRILFDPPATSFHTTAVENQIKETEWRLNNMREVAVAINLPDPIIPSFVPGDVVTPDPDPDPDPDPELEQPYNLSVDAVYDQIQISWDPTPNVEIYTVYWRVVGNELWNSDVYVSTGDFQSVNTPSSEGVEYEHYVEVSATDFTSVESDHFFTTGIAQEFPQLDPPVNAAVTVISGAMHVTWDPTPNAENIRVLWWVSGEDNFEYEIVPVGNGMIDIPVEDGIEYIFQLLSTATGYLPGYSENFNVTGVDFPDLDPPINALVEPFSDSGDSRMQITWEDTPNVEFVLIWFRVVGDEDWDVNGWGIDQLSVVQLAEVGVDYEYYLQSTAEGYDPAESEHFFVTGV